MNFLNYTVGLRGNITNITYDDFNYTEITYFDERDYDAEIQSWSEWFASWFW
jgi:hypothetical protein